jgi:hypothetical protein
MSEILHAAVQRARWAPSPQGGEGWGEGGPVSQRYAEPNPLTPTLSPLGRGCDLRSSQGFFLVRLGGVSSR